MKKDHEIVKRLVNEYGSPLYLFDKKEFVRNYKNFVDCMRNEYDKYVLSYSYKTNYAPYICKLVKDLGGYAEVVSDMEYYFAKKIGYKDSEIIYNGPVKGELGYDMLLNGGKLNVDSIDELKRIIEFSKNHPDNLIKIGLRVNIDIGQDFISRFGIDSESQDLYKAVQMVEDIDNLEIQGLHCHVGRSRTTKSWTNRANRIIQIVDTYFKNQKLEYIDLGSGMYGEMDNELSVQFGSDLPAYTEYAAAIGEVFRSYYSNHDYADKPVLFTEPGTTIVNHYIDFVGTVSSIKSIKNKEFVVLDCSKHNLGEISYLKKLPINIIHNGDTFLDLEDASIVGYTCLEHDVMYTGFHGELGIGDYIIFSNVGGYSNVQKPPFILPNCPMISIEGDKVDIIKRKETFDDILSTYVM